MCIEPPSLQNPLTKKHDINFIKNILEDKSLTIVITIISIKNVETNNKSKKIYENFCNFFLGTFLEFNSVILYVFYISILQYP